MELNLTHISPLPTSVIEFIESLAKNINVNRIIVFGSRANSDYNKYSDLDLAIDAPSITKIEWLQIKEYAYYDVRTVIQISLIHYNINPLRLQNQILTTGKIIYVK
ncbi:nucleotidyltransferase domain-containing protein [[Flexibacter] sp. ATCC 35103]|uniref:nucleotidyltransferase domain-containing protein n=1 Tax=[Flexibacter] sp. ATCC 35103 TaxID=1937528 RepID=UPI0009CD98CF|nr:nucleotidyltransferase domain-containing protein [[Flexibacter] sp. ATCC 35103]OMQ12887.1 hypothetical protein BXU01_04330 [[Flexibacter] sp. ATCC 35103]